MSEDGYRVEARALFLRMLYADPEAWHELPDGPAMRLVRAGLVQWRGRRGSRRYRLHPETRDELLAAFRRSAVSR